MSSMRLQASASTDGWLHPYCPHLQTPPALQSVIPDAGSQSPHSYRNRSGPIHNFFKGNETKTNVGEKLQGTSAIETDLCHTFFFLTSKSEVCGIHSHKKALFTCCPFQLYTLAPALWWSARLAKHQLFIQYTHLNLQTTTIKPRKTIRTTGIYWVWPFCWYNVYILKTICSESGTQRG